MSTIWGAGDEVITTEFPDIKFQKYLDKYQISEKNKFTLPKVKEIFLECVTDFKTGYLALDELAEIAGYFLANCQEKYWDLEDSKLCDILHMCSEWIFYVRHVDEDDSSGTFVWFFKEVMEYYHQNMEK